MNLYGLLYSIAWKLIQVYCFIFRPQTIGVRVMVFNEGRVLLVKHSYRSKYYFPGGSLNKNELLIDCAAREVWEETNLRVTNLKLLGAYRSFEEYRSDTIGVFVSDKIENLHDLQIDHKEIIEVGWFDINNLPKDLSKGTSKRIDEYINKKDTSHGIWS